MGGIKATRHEKFTFLEKHNIYCNWKTANNNHQKTTTWKAADKQHVILLHSHTEMCQDNKDQLEPRKVFMAEHN